MIKKEDPRLHELTPVARGNQDAGSRNLGPAFFTSPPILPVFSQTRFGFDKHQRDCSRRRMQLQLQNKKMSWRDCPRWFTTNHHPNG